MTAMATRKINLSTKNARARILLDKVINTKGFKEKIERFREGWEIHPLWLEDEDCADFYRWHDWDEYLDDDLAAAISELLTDLKLPEYFFETCYRYLMTDEFISTTEEDPDGLVLVVDDKDKTANLIIGPNTTSSDYKKSWSFIKKNLPFKIVDPREDKLTLAVKMHVYREYRKGKTIVEIRDSLNEYIAAWEGKTRRKIKKESYQDLQYIRDIVSKENKKHGVPKSEIKRLRQGRTEI